MEPATKNIFRERIKKKKQVPSVDKRGGGAGAGAGNEMTAIREQKKTGRHEKKKEIKKRFFMPQTGYSCASSFAKKMENGRTCHAPI